MSNRISPEIRLQVALRANGLCEYCLLAEEDCFFRHQVEHIISLKDNGSSELENLALACVFCNRNKGSDIASLIPGTNRIIRFYGPRKDRWSDNFQLAGVFFEAMTEIAEVTIRILQINHPERILERETLNKLGRYPNEAANLLMIEH